MIYVNYVILIMVFIITAYLLNQLVIWRHKYKAWLLNLSKPAHQEHEGEMSTKKLHDPIMNDFYFSDLKGNSFYSNDVLKDKDYLLIFLNEECELCGSNFEFFSQLLADRKHTSEIMIFFQNDQIEVAQNFYEVYYNEFPVYLYHKKTLKDLNVNFFPAYIKIDTLRKIEVMTHNPVEIAHRLELKL